MAAPTSSLFPYTTLFRSGEDELGVGVIALDASPQPADVDVHGARLDVRLGAPYEVQQLEPIVHPIGVADEELEDRKSTRLNSSHEWISYAVFCLTKKTTT